ncbi:MAG: TIGR01212 family radical SAM protein [Muribaculaceae bacterium]|nr:TIGR01212 family radical SAM protein [Muribaculaceae bacterium]MDY6412289.1 TIGR01212 family radical SAM protein [Bacteroidales bacterium]
MVTNRPEYSVFLKDIYGCRVQKLNVNAGFTCPNRDGTLAHGGCIYCNNASFTPAFGNASVSITRQIEDGKKFYAKKYSDMHYLAYFQSFTGTYAPIPALETLYAEALAVPDVVGLVVSTRPDCLNDDVLNLLSDINLTHPVIVEIGIESSHDRTLQLINRRHTWQCAHDAIERVVERGITAGAHLILGLPWETHNDMLTTAKRIAELPLSTVKFHQLQVIKGTKLAQLWEKGQVDLTQWSASQYAAFCKEIIELLPPHMVIERMVSTAPSQLLLHPKWGLKPQQFKEIFQNIL